MSEKRKPTITIIAQVLGKNQKKRIRIELYRRELWPRRTRRYANDFRFPYRVRVNRKWAKGSWTFTKVLEQLRKQAIRVIKGRSGT